MDNVVKDRTLPIPKELSARSNVKALLGLGYAALLFFGSWVTIGLLWSSDASLLVKGLGAVPFLVLAGYGMLLMGFMGHDGTHFTLHEDKVVSSALGVLITAPVFPYMVMGFTISHWNHHKFTNGEEDPDAAVFARFNTLFGRMFLARPYSFWEYGSNTVRLALGIPLPFKYQFPLPPETVRNLARLNVLLTLAFGALYGTVAASSPTFFAALATIYIFGTAISGLSPFIEHTGTGLGRGHDTRTSGGAWFDVLILGNNYHLEHHLYPTVPFYNLKRVHEYLVEQGYYAQSDRYVSQGFWDTYRYALGKYPYPKFPKNPPGASH